MKTIKLLILWVMITNLGIIHSQEKKFELGYNISGWYENVKGSIPQTEKRYFFNNNVKLGYKLKPFLSVGLSTNFCYRLVNSKTPNIYAIERIYYDVVTSKDYAFGTGPYAKIIFGKNFKIFSTLEYDYFLARGRLTIYDEYHNKSQAGLFKNLNHSFFGEIGFEKKVGDNLNLSLFFQKQYIFIFKYRPIDNGGEFKPETKSFVGLGINYNFNFKTK
jgi:hypothetical protein